jgi:hypothetical protein
VKATLGDGKLKIVLKTNLNFWYNVAARRGWLITVIELELSILERNTASVNRKGHDNVESYEILNGSFCCMERKKFQI